jgi:hypothetical protein
MENDGNNSSFGGGWLKKILWFILGTIVFVGATLVLRTIGPSS